MCAPAAAIVPSLIGAVASTVIGQAMAPKKSEAAAPAAAAPAQAAQTAAPPSPQAAKRPGEAGVRAGMQNAAQGQSTLLTGPKGVEPNLLSLGTNTLLGR